MEYNQLVTFFVVLLAIAGGISVFGNAVKTIRDWIAPVSSHVDRIDALELHLDNDNKRLNQLEESNKLLLRGINVLIDSKLDGNHIDELNQVKDDITHYLINK